MTDRLPVWTTVVASARTAVAFTRRHPIFFLGLWVLQILVDGLSAMGGSIGYSPSPISPAWTNAVELAQMVLGAPILLALYRFVLGDERSPTYDVVSPRGRKFVAANVAYLICAMMLPGAIFATIHRYAETYGGVAAWGGLALAIAILVPMIAYWSGRLYLLFPLIALDEPAPLARSLAMTRGRAWRIL
jgi:hypothetical protein